MKDLEVVFIAVCTGILFATLGALALAQDTLDNVEPPFCQCGTDTDCQIKCGGNGDPLPVGVLP